MIGLVWSWTKAALWITILVVLLWWGVASRDGRDCINANTHQLEHCT